MFTRPCTYRACARLSAAHTRGDREGELTDRTTSLIRMTGVLRAELDGRIQRLYSSSRNCEQEWMSTPARCFLQGWGTGAPDTGERRPQDASQTSQTTKSSDGRKAKAGGDLELTGDVGGDTGVGTSVSSSSSSSHSSSRRGVMLFPSHTEWMDTFNRQGHLGHRSGTRQQVPRPRVLSCRRDCVLCTEQTLVTRQSPFSPSAARADSPMDWGRGISDSPAAALRTWNRGS